MRIRRTFPIALVVVIVAAAVTIAVQLRKQAPPEPARLLPGADAFLYADFSWARRLSASTLPAVSHDPDYERFIQETGDTMHIGCSPSARDFFAQVYQDAAAKSASAHAF